MKVTPVKRKFGKYEVGQVFEVPDGAARLFIKVGKLKQADDSSQTYQTRMMQAEPVNSTPEPILIHEAEAVDPAPHGYKADGTPRKRAAPKPKASE